MGLYERIKEIAKEKGTSINRIEKELNLPRSSISKFNKNTPSIDKILLIANHLGVTVDYLTGKEKGHSDGYYYDQEAADMAQQLFDDPSLRVLFDAARGSSPDDLKMAADLLKRLKGTNDG